MEPQSFDAYVRANFSQQNQDLYDIVMGAYEGIEQGISWLDSQAEAVVKATLPENITPIAMRVLRTIPESFVVATCMSGSGLPALAYLGVRMFEVCLPQIKELIMHGFDAKITQAGLINSAKELFATYKEFTPAIAVCAAIATVFCLVFGVATRNVATIMRAPLYAIVAYLAVSDMLRGEEAAQIPVEGAVPGNGGHGRRPVDGHNGRGDGPEGGPHPGKNSGPARGAASAHASQPSVHVPSVHVVEGSQLSGSALAAAQVGISVFANAQAAHGQDGEALVAQTDEGVNSTAKADKKDEQVT